MPHKFSVTQWQQHFVRIPVLAAWHHQLLGQLSYYQDLILI